MSESKVKKNIFKLIKKTILSETKADETVLPESDLCFQHGDNVYQFEKLDEEEKLDKYPVKPGVFTVVETTVGLKLIPTEFKKTALLQDIVNTKSILDEARNFFDNLDVYRELTPESIRRSVMLSSSPGIGKTTAIAKLSDELTQEDAGTVVINWPTDQIKAGTFYKFLNLQVAYQPECTRLVLVIEDIGGAEEEGSYGPRGTPSSLLNLLDGVGITFKLPTFIIATTNHPENLTQSLADRPGRFDLFLELQPPGPEERVKLVEFIAKRQLTDQEKEALTNKKANDLTPAHLKELVIRSLLHKKSISQIIEEMRIHTEKFKKAFSKSKKMGIGDLGF